MHLTTTATVVGFLEIEISWPISVFFGSSDGQNDDFVIRVVTTVTLSGMRVIVKHLQFLDTDTLWYNLLWMLFTRLAIPRSQFISLAIGWSLIVIELFSCFRVIACGHSHACQGQHQRNFDDVHNNNIYSQIKDFTCPCIGFTPHKQYMSCIFSTSLSLTPSALTEIE